MSGGDPIYSLVRALHIGGAMLLAAFPVFAVFHGKPAADRERHEEFCRAARAVLGVALLVEIVTGGAWFWLASASMNDVPPAQLAWADLGAVLTQTRFGQLWIVRGLIALALAGLLAFGRTTKRGSLALGCALLGSLAWAGHAVSGVRWQAWHLFVDVIHLLSGAVWPVGLVPLAFFLALRPRSGMGMTETDRAVVRRFSQASFFAVFALAASGVANSWLMLPSWSALIDSLYGRLLLAKVVVVVVMIALGALNRYRFMPALATDGPARLARTIAVESGLAVVVLVIVGVMGATAPPS